MPSKLSTVPGATAAGPIVGYVLLALLSVVWGVNWPVMKFVLADISVWWFRSICLIASGFGLLALAAMGGQRLLLARHEIGPLLVCSVFSILGWHICSAYGVTMMASGKAAIIAYTMPVWATLGGWWLLGERLTPTKIIGLLLGLGGLAVLIGPDLQTLSTTPLGGLFMLGAAFAWGVGTVLFKRFSWSVPVITCIAWQIIIGCVPITLIAIAAEPLPDFSALSAQAWWAFAYVIVLAMTFGQWAYFKIVHLFPASIAAIGTLAVPAIGVVSGAVLLAEPVGPRELVALGLICAALVTILVLPQLQTHRRR